METRNEQFIISRKFNNEVWRFTAIDDLSFDAKNNQITSIIGPNGAGKTTVFNCLTGFYKPTNGQMFLHQS